MSFVDYNPVKNTDPSGHITKGEAKDANNILNQLLLYDIKVIVDWGEKGFLWAKWWENGKWTLAMLNTLLDGVQQLATAMGGVDKFKNKLGGITVGLKAMNNSGEALAHSVMLNENGFTTWTVVHEFAHAWDGANGWDLSAELEKKPVERLIG